LAQRLVDESGRSAVVLTFLIADVRGYTRFTRERGDAAAAILAKRFADLARDAVEARGGRVIELRGDEALAVFDSPQQAVLAALEFQATCAEESEADPALPLPVGIGIDTGEAVPVEDGYRGVALNMAARLCSNAAPGQVLVTRTIVGSAEAMGGEITFVERGPATFKGFDQPIDVIEAVAAEVQERPVKPAVAEADRGIPPELDPLTPLVDRDHEMRWLRGTWRQVRRGRGRVLFVSGPTQIGKTRLAGEIAAHVHADGGLVRYTGPGGAATAMALSAIRETLETASPTLLVLDDVDVAGPKVAQAILSSFEGLAALPVLVLVLLRDAAASSELVAALERADQQGDGHRTLAPLDLDGVRGIVHLYAGDDTAEVPVESMARASGGVPGRVHEVVADWARSEASRRLAAAAEFLAVGRDRHAQDLEFANNVIGLKLGRLYSVEGRDVLSIETCPYKGLAQFETDDSAYFFGRERLVGELAARTVQVGLLGVVGASGSGKSSVIAAGLLPSLRAGLLPGSDGWRQASIRPGEHPMEALRAALGYETGDPPAAAIAIPSDGRLVLVVDQFEETFTTCATEEERAAFIDALTDAAKRWPEQVAVILALPADYYGHCAPYPELAEALGANHVLVGPLTREELRRAIELPARRAGLRVESVLADALIEEVADEPGGLPLLSTALVELWQAREGGWIRMEAHERSGGVQGAVSRLAESSYEQLSDAEQEAARRVFLRLVAIGEGEAVTRRRVSLDEFDLDRDAAVAGMLARLTQDRLLTMGEDTVEVAHEALLREWPRLHGWLEEDAQGRQLRQHITQAARQWQSGEQEASELYRGARLSAALDWSGGHAAELNELEREFISASRQAGEREAERQRRTNRRLRGLLAGVAVFLVLALVAGALALVQRGSARHSAHEAERSATAALAQSLGAQAVSEPRIDLAMLLAREAVALDPSARTRSDLFSTLLRVRTAVRTFHAADRIASVSVSWDGTLLATSDFNDHIAVRDTATGRVVGTTQGGPVVFGPDGSLLQVHSDTNTTTGIAVVDPRTGATTRTIAVPSAVGRALGSGPNGQISFDRSGRLMAVALLNSGSGSGYVLQFDYRTGALAASPIPTRSPFAAYLPGDRRILESGKTTTVVNARTGQTLRSYPVGSGARGAVSPDGRTEAVGGQDGSIHFLDLRTGRVTLGIGSHGGVVNAVDFTPDGRTLVSSGDDGKTFLWDVATHKIRQTLAGHAEPILPQAVSRDGSTLYTGSSDENVVAWDLTGRRGFLRSFVGANDTPGLSWSLATSPDGRTIAVGSSTGLVNLWDAETLRRVQSFQGVPGVVADLRFSPDGRSLLVAGDTPAPGRAWLRLWGLGPTPRLLRSFHPTLPRIALEAFSPDGKTVAATGRRPDQDFLTGGLVAEWDVSTGKPVVPITVVKGGEPFGGLSFAPHGDRLLMGGPFGVDVVDPAQHPAVRNFIPSTSTYPFDLGYSPDGSTLATVDFGGRVQLWDPGTGHEVGAPAQLTPHVGLSSMAWSPDGRTVATVDWSGTVYVVDVATGRQVIPAFPVPLPSGTPTGPLTVGLAFAPDSDLVVTDENGDTWVYPLVLKAWEDRACQIANRNFTRAEWRDLLPGKPYRQVCPVTSTG
jgi:WD40 repeat protein/class 3 adenylate cyclase